MPEYSQIQSYIRYNETNFKKVIVQFKNLLREIGFKDSYIKDNFQEIAWEEADNGFVYLGSNFETKTIKYRDYSLSIRPSMMGWTPRIDKRIKEEWLEIELLFETEEITFDYSTGRLKAGIKELILDYISLFSKYFNETGVYFTDEATDAKPWEALVGIEEYIWGFDIAVIPKRLEVFYEDIPAGFVRYDLERGCIYIRNVL